MNEDIVLIVEDNVVMGEGLKEMLEEQGFQVYNAEDGIEALELMAKVQPALIISDINMPRMDGFEFFSAVREREEWLAIPFIYLTARSEISDVITGKNLGVEDYLVKPISKDELITTVRSRLGRFRQVQVGQLQQAYIASLTALANAIEERERDTYGHIERVTSYSLLLADYLGWHERRLRGLRFGAILHDLGKIHIPEEVLFKEVPLGEADWETIKLHPVTGEKMIKDVEDLAECAPIVRHHHERWDGKGYPDGLLGEQIPPGARIVAVADSFDTMTLSRPYRKARSPQEAYGEILKLAGLNYDPTVVVAFRRAWEDGKIQEIYSQR